MTLAVEQAQRREAAGLSNDIRSRLQKKEEAIFLIGKNKEHFGLENIEIIKADA